MSADNPFHAGELAVQERAGARQAARINAAALSPHIPSGAVPFIEQQGMAVLGSLDTQGNVWASLLFGEPGFVSAEDERHVVLDQATALSAAGDPLWQNLADVPQVGMLLIELATRRRLRINGIARHRSGGRWRIEVERSYGNCPKYIQARHLLVPRASTAHNPSRFREGRRLETGQRAWIAQADTCFVASAHPEQGADASHRGGNPGFIQVLSPDRLRLPDYAGNRMFNTLGNFASYPHAGLLFIDFERGRILQLCGRPEIRWNLTDEEHATGGTARFWDFIVQRWRESELPLRPQWRFIAYSPHNPRSKEDNHAQLTLRIEKTWQATDHIKTFELARTDGQPLPAFEAGAHLPVRVRDRSGAWVERCYSLLSDPTDTRRYRIAVLAEPKGRGGSLYLHHALHTGDILHARTPANGFPLRSSAEHSILIAGGIGITPLLSMLHALRTGARSFELHYSAKRWSGLAFRAEINALAEAQTHFYASQEPGAPRLDLEELLSAPKPGTHVYVCGPRRMILAVRETAEKRGWLSGQIHVESFGAPASTGGRALTVTLARSQRTIDVPAGSSILDVLLEAGIAVPHDCKRGECSQCATRVLAGEPEHQDLCLSPSERAHAMCVCISRARSAGLTLDL
ncbi:MAG: pyridoxamine 5'-phosphate oxidase family protein [Chromatiales bacterium]|nr:pyridoxamine 5'-phosphate oxidase family protein [Chromatiales bacterium]